MAEQTKISWADATFNPWMGCTKVSAGCKNCYAETLTKNRMGIDVWGKSARRQVTSDANWKKPVRWNREAEGAAHRPRVFCGSLCDVFESNIQTEAARMRLWDLIEATPNLDWLLLTKRPEVMRDTLPWNRGHFGWVGHSPNVWIGTSIETAEYAWRADVLREIPAAVRFISYEPALGPLGSINLTGIDWVIYGGESGPGHRKDETSWSVRMFDRCLSRDVAFWMKQRSGPRPGEGGTVRGVQVRELPSPRRGVVVHGEQATLGFSKEGS